MRVKNYNITIDPDGVFTVLIILTIVGALMGVGMAGYAYFGNPTPDYNEETGEYEDVDGPPISDIDPVSYPLFVILGVMYTLMAAIAVLLVALVGMVILLLLGTIFDVEKDDLDEGSS